MCVCVAAIYLRRPYIKKWSLHHQDTCLTRSVREIRQIRTTFCHFLLLLYENKHLQEQAMSFSVNTFTNKHIRTTRSLKTSAESQTASYSACSALHSVQSPLFRALRRAPMKGERFRFGIEPEVIRSSHLIPSFDLKRFLEVYNIAIRAVLFCLHRYLCR